MMRGAGWIALVAVPLAGLALALWLGGPSEPTKMSHIAESFRHADYSALPAATTYPSRSGRALAYRAYAPAEGSARGSVVLVHGSSATGSSMHPMAQALAAAGYRVYALDMRGHGASGDKGQIDFVGQLEDDVEDFVQAVQPSSPRTLLGFSSGGGFVLRWATGARKTLFQSYLLLSPFLHQDAPTQRKDSGGWVSIGVPRLIAIALLNHLGLTLFNHLPVTRFAVDPSNRDLLTERYSFALADNFRPHYDYLADLRADTQPTIVLAGTNDEAFFSDHFAGVFSVCPGLRRVQILPGLDHAAMVLDPAALAAAISAVGELQGARPGSG